VILASLLVAGAVLLELRHLHTAGFALLAVAVGVASQRSDHATLAAVLAGCAVVLLWRSLVRGSSFGHLLFVAAAAAAAYLLMPGSGAMQTLPLAILVATFLVVELLALKLHAASSFHADLTSVVALLVATIVLAAEIASTRFSLYVLAVLLLSVIVIRPWIGTSKLHRVQPAAHAAFRAVGIAVAATLVVAGARLAGLTAGQQIFALACTGWLVLATLLRSEGGASGLATAAALHAIAAGVYVSAYVVRNGEPFLLLACLVAAGGYLAWRAASKEALLEHCAAIGIIEAIALWGAARHIAWLEFYLFPAAAYLGLVLLRQTAPARSRDAIAAIVIAAGIGYPFVALVRTAQNEHLAYLALSSVVVIHVLLASRRHALMVFAVCAMLGIGMLFGIAVLHGDLRLNLLMAVVGFLVIADLGLIGFRSDRQLVVGEIEL
jgi:hypothetical protein